MQESAFHRPVLWSEQACIEAIHVVCLVAGFMWNQFGIHIRSRKKKNDRAKQLKGKTQSSKIPTKNTCSGHSSGPPFWCVQDVLKHVRLHNDQTYTWHMVWTSFYCHKNHAWKKSSTYFFHTHVFYKVPGLDPPPQGFRKRKQANCIQNGKAIYPP